VLAVDLVALDLQDVVARARGESLKSQPLIKPSLDERSPAASLKRELLIKAAHRLRRWPARRERVALRLMVGRVVNALEEATVRPLWCVRTWRVPTYSVGPLMAGGPRARNPGSPQPGRRGRRGEP
jgi:hypothetical protein